MTEGIQVSLFSSRSVEELVEDIEKLTKQIQELYCLDDIPWILGYSGGKDSGAVVQLVWYAIAALPPEKLTKIIYVITTDTLVENPIVSAWVRKSLERINSAAKAQGLPIESHLLYPDIKDTFWVNLIGKGYPSPRHRFRWCTERLKIHPSNRFVRDVVRINGEVIVVLGTRKAESIKRAASMEKHEVGLVSDRLNPNPNSLKSLLYHSPSLPNSLVYSPIQDWRTDEVWLYLMQWPNPWGHNNKDLFTMYRGATADNECPLVVDSSTPSCGSSRFGCWVCTLVNQDKSMEAMILNDEEKEWMQPLLDIRNELDIEDDRDKRDFRRIYGRVELFERNMGEGETSVQPIPGPYTKYWREHWLRRVLEAQTLTRKTAPPDMGEITLITPEELSEIRRIWLEEKHEFDDSLPKIYQEVTGEPFEDTRPFDERKLLGNDEWDVLQTICENDTMHLELMSKLLNTERQYYTKPRRTGIFLDIDKCFDTSSRIKEEAIDNAHYQRQVKTALETVKEDPHEIQQIREAIATIEDPEKSPNTNPKNIKQISENKGDKNKQLSWGDMKFPLLNLINENPTE
ncbi:DNA phosphorothioation system sulfurtransferase DndC [Phormidium nigroviride]